ncbi:MAG: S8 family serine peptidase [Candidatus Cryptobacteroides sp.]
MARTISETEGVIKVQYNKRIRRIASEVLPYIPEPSLSLNSSVVETFDDPQLPSQWHLINTGNTNVCKTAVEGADAGVKDAWTLTAGDPSVIVAIMDEAVMYTHPDLAANMWKNEAEASGKAGVDDDGNGYVDDIYGFNFVTGTAELCWSHKNDIGHGTHVAGTVAAVNNNGTGVCGVAGGTGRGDGVRLMSCQIFDGDEASSASLARALRYAADNGASIAQCSLGYESGLFSSADDYKRQCAAEFSGITYFLDKVHNNTDVLDGNIIIFSAGNESGPVSSYPAALDEVISVTSFGPGFQPAGYTNYGPGCNIAAPGGDYYVGRSGYNKQCQVLSTVFDKDLNPDYGWMEGTSMACPHVSGVAALGLSYARKIGKHFTREEFISMLLTSTIGIDKYFTGTKPKTATTTMDLSEYVGKMGTGAVNAWKFLMQIEGTPSVQIVLGVDSVDLAAALGDPGLVLTDYSVEIDPRYAASMGLEGELKVEDGVLTINSTRVGSGKLKVTAKSSWTSVSREISVISRPARSIAGGWF